MNAVLQYIEDHKGRFLEDLCRYVRFPSVSAQPAHRADMAACAEWLVKHCQQIGLEAEIRPTAGHPVVVAKTQRTGKPSYLVYGHYDVQPPEPFELWKSPPFEPRLEGRRSFRARRVRQQRPKPRPFKRRRSLSENRHRTAVRFDFCDRGRGGGRQQTSGGISQGLPQGIGLPRGGDFGHRHAQS